MTLTAERLREVLSYDEQTGAFTWRKVGVTSWKKVGDLAGFINYKGYVVIVVGKKQYAAHRLAWLYVHGDWPPALIDHINGDQADNRIANLRSATTTENQWNRKANRNSKSGFKGVFPDPHGKGWVASISVKGKRINLGRFRCPTAAHLAYCRAAKAHHGEFARVA